VVVSIFLFILFFISWYLFSFFFSRWIIGRHVHTEIHA